MSTIRGLRATATAGLVAAALLLAPAGFAFASPSTDVSTPTPTTNGSTDVRTALSGPAAPPTAAVPEGAGEAWRHQGGVHGRPSSNHVRLEIVRRQTRPCRRRDPSARHIRKIANEMVVTNTDTGTPGARDSRMPPTAEISAKTTDATIVGRRRDEHPRRGGRRGDQQRHHQQRADDLHALRGGDPDQGREHDAQRAHGNSASGGHLGVDGGEQQRPEGHRQHRDDEQPTPRPTVPAPNSRRRRSARSAGRSWCRCGPGRGG